MTVFGWLADGDFFYDEEGALWHKEHIDSPIAREGYNAFSPLTGEVRSFEYGVEVQKTSCH